MVRNGYLPERDLLTGLGPGPVRIPKVRDRSGSGVKFNSALVPPYVRKAQRVEAALPWLYLRGISTGDLQEALSVLLGTEAQGLSPAVVSRLKAEWAEAYAAWNRRDLSDEHSVYVWADGIYSAPRGEDDRLCLLVLIGVNEQGEKRLLALSDGYRESKASWRALLQDLQARGLNAPSALGIGDGALGFWAALDEAWPQTRHQRCWVHKTANVLNALPTSIQGKAKAGLQEIWMAETQAQANTAFDRFTRDFGAKYPKAVALLAKDRAALLAFTTFRPSTRFRPILAVWSHLRVAGLLRLSGRALGSHSHHPPDRIELRHHPAPYHPNQALRVPEHLARLGVPMGADGGEQLAQAGGLQALARGGQGCPVSGWYRHRRSTQ